MFEIAIQNRQTWIASLIACACGMGGVS